MNPKSFILTTRPESGSTLNSVVWREVAALAAARIPAEAALAAGSWKARRFLGLPRIEEGAPADLVALERDPREDLTVLATPSLIVMNGRVVRGVAASTTA